ncbi:MAG: thioredoxin domain-containing protein [Oligoflexia bacterium]|nr:thioredoxin domain-containing protein [Oligoflexia bacterium]
MQKIRKSYFSFTLATLSAVAVAFAVISACSGQQAKAKPNFVFKDAPKAGVVAKINGEEITEEQLIGDEKLEFLDLRKREYELKMNQLNKLLTERLIGAEAKKANLPLEEFINKKVVGGEVKISDQDYKNFVKEKHIPESQLNPQVKERIMAYLQGMKKQDLVQAYIGKLTKSSPVEVYFTKPKLQVNVEAGNGPFFGGKDAAVTIVEFSDFQCPFCSRAAETVTQLKKKYGNKIKLAFRHFPLPMHREARPASEASMCVNEQGTDKFWRYHDILFKNMDKLDAANLEKYAKEVGADVKKFQECVTAKKYAAHVQADMEYGEKIGVRSTPTFFINGQLISGAVPLEQFSEVIDEELAAKK